MRITNTPPHKSIRSDIAAATQQRDSNIELLRLVCMFMVLLNHCLGVPITPNGEAILTKTSAFGLSFRYFTFVAVECFVLVSGYYGIRFKLRSLVNLYLMCAFYGLLGYLVHIFTSDAQVGRSLIYNSVFCFSHNSWWFIQCYLGLYLLSPLINLATQYLNKRKYLIVIILYTIVECYFGWLWSTEFFDTTGFAMSQFIYMYLIGGYIRKFTSIEQIRAIRRKSLWMYIGFCLLGGILLIIETKMHMPQRISNYHSPILIVASIGFFLFMLSFSFKNKFINFIAPSALAVYLIHGKEYIGELMYPQLGNLCYAIESRFSWISALAIEFTTILLICVVIFCICIVIDLFRRWLMKPIWKIYNRVEPWILSKCKILLFYLENNDLK